MTAQASAGSRGATRADYNVCARGVLRMDADHRSPAGGRIRVAGPRAWDGRAAIFGPRHATIAPVRAWARLADSRQVVSSLRRTRVAFEVPALPYAYNALE